MQIQLRTASPGDIPAIETWAQAIDAERLMSRYLPDQAQAVRWDIVIVDGNEVGTIWMERKIGLPQVVFLGILIGQPELLGKGIGHAVISKVIADVRAIEDRISIRLNVRATNTRAIACYRKCGFVQIALGHKVGSGGALIPVITMQI
jgi:RimJ/RimL family protein N-acetyltransferase